MQPVVATFSDGTALSGEARLIGARPLILVPLGEKRQRMFQLADLAAVAQEIETAGMERPWTFKESGKPEKVYLDGEYPLINFRTRLTLVNGGTVTGHVISAAFAFKSGSGSRKLFLQRQIKGSISEKMDDIVYLQSLRLTGNAITAGKPLRGQVEGFGSVLSVTALDNERSDVLYARVIPGNRFDFGMMLPGSYDLCVLTDSHVLTGLSAAVPHDKDGDTLQPGDLDAIRKKFPLADDFFKDRWVLAVQGSRDFAKALVYKRRADYYDAKRWTPGGFLWHLEIWSWHLAGTEWKVDRRFILVRHKQQGGEQNRVLVTGPLLDAVTPGQDLLIRSDGTDHATWHLIRNLD